MVGYFVAWNIAPHFSRSKMEVITTILLHITYLLLYPSVYIAKTIMYHTAIDILKASGLILLSNTDHGKQQWIPKCCPTGATACFFWQAKYCTSVWSQYQARCLHFCWPHDFINRDIQWKKVFECELQEEFFEEHYLFWIHFILWHMPQSFFMTLMK